VAGETLPARSCYLWGCIKKGLHRNAAPFKIQYPMKNRRLKYNPALVFKAAFDERTDLFDKRLFFGD
jgi:hypothetical protein